MATQFLTLLLFVGITSGYHDPKGHAINTRHKRQAITDPNLNNLTRLAYPLKDANYYLSAYKAGSTDAAVLAMAKAMDWNSVKNLNNQNVATWTTMSYNLAKLDLTSIHYIAKIIKEFGVVISGGDPAYRHQTGFQITSNITANMTPAGLVNECTTLKFKFFAGLSNKAVTGLPLLDPTATCLSEQGTMLNASFQNNIVCNATSPYRNIDGSCNNLANALQGAAFRKYRRSLLPDYSDGVSAPRKNSIGFNLPSARLVSTTINRLPNAESSDLSAFHMVYGQFLDHDFTSTPITVFPNVTTILPYATQPISCCDLRFVDLAGIFSNQLGCFPIDIPLLDPFYAPQLQTCMEFKRSAPAASCTMGPREQINELSAYIDGSMIYGVKPPVNGIDPLRTMTNGLLKVQAGNLLPPATKPDNGCNTPEFMALGQFCFMAGDSRANEQIFLAFFHTVFAREHNRLAAILLASKSNYNDEKLYQETRRIVAAQLQHITYNEFLPTIIPNDLMDSAGLKVGTGANRTNIYNASIDASIANNFGVAAYRFGHSQVGDFHNRVTKYGTIETVEFSSTFLNPFYLYTNESMENMARGGLQTRSRKVDSYFTKEVSGKLFRGNSSFGLDLVALNIQRGRDHGIPGYIKWLNYCGMNVSSFSGLSVVMTSDSITALQSVYSNINDVDLFAGAMSEFTVSGGFLGYTFTCLITDQFKRLKYGDRFWYEEASQAGSFTTDQMKQLHNVTLARIMCSNIPELKVIQRYPLRNPGPDNPVLPCNGTDIPVFNLTAWN